MREVIVQISGLTFEKELPRGVPIEATDVLAEMADTKAMREGVVAVIWADEEKAEPKASDDPNIPGAPPAVEAKVDDPKVEGKKANPMTMKNEEMITELTGMNITVPRGTRRSELISLLSKARKGMV